MGVVIRVPPSLAGRLESIQIIEQVVAEAAAGNPRVLLLAGESGMGKTRLVRHVVDFATAKGFRVGYGRASEGDDRSHGVLLGALRPILNSTGWHGAEHADAVRRLTNSIVRSSADRPVAVALDDLQWAGTNTLRLLADVAGALIDIGQPAAPVLIVGAQRTTGSDRAALSLFTRLRREQAVRSVVLRGLSGLEVNDFVRQATGADCGPGLLDQLSDVTRGNPLLLLETLDAMERSGELTLSDGVLRSQRDPREMELAGEVAGALRTRLQELPADVRTALIQVALVGDEFTFREAQVATEAADADLTATFETGLRARVLEETTEGFAFAHPVVRHSLRMMWSAERRRRAHLEIARRLQRASSESGEGEARAAHHYVAARLSPLPPGVGELLCRAGERAAAAGDWNSTVRFLGPALDDTQFAGSLSSAEAGRLEFMAGRAWLFSPDASRARQFFERSILHHKDTPDYEAWAAALAGWARTFLAFGHALSNLTPLEDFLANGTGASASARADVLAQVATARWLTRSPGDLEAAEEAVRLAVEAEDPAMVTNTHVVLGLARLRVLDIAGALDSFESADRTGRGVDNPRVQGWGQERIPVPLLMLGRLDDAERVAMRASARGRETMEWSGPAQAHSALAIVHSLLGRPEAEQTAAGAALVVHRAQYAGAAQLLFPELARLRALGGAWAEAEDAEQLWERWTRSGLARPLRLLRLARSGSADAARSELAATPLRAITRRGIDFNVLGSLGIAVDLAAELDVPLPDDGVYEAFAGLADRGVVFTVAPAALTMRLAGKAAMLRGMREEAGSRLIQAIDIASSVGARTELGLGYLDLARWYLQGGQSDAAEDTANEALALFRRLGLSGAEGMAVALLARLGSHLPAARAAQRPSGVDLSSRELEVVSLIAAGCTNQQIADRLVISLNTVATHVRSIFNKTGCSNRAAAARWAGVRGLAVTETTS